MAQVDDSTLGVVSEVCYLGDMVSAGGGCTQAIIARSRVAWGKFKRLISIATCKHMSLLAHAECTTLMSVQLCFMEVRYGHPQCPTCRDCNGQTEQ